MLEAKAERMKIENEGKRLTIEYAKKNTKKRKESNMNVEVLGEEITNILLASIHNQLAEMNHSLWRIANKEYKSPSYIHTIVDDDGKVHFDISERIN